MLFTTPLLLVPLAGGPRLPVLGMLFAAEFASGFGVMVLDIGALAAGALGALIGLRPTLWLAAGGAVLGVVWLLPSPLPGYRLPAPSVRPARGTSEQPAGNPGYREA